MAYNGDMTWGDVAAIASYDAKLIKDALINGSEQRKEWLNFKASPRFGTGTNAEVAAELGVTEATIDDVDELYLALIHLYQCANDVAVSQADRLEMIMKFS